MVIAAFLINFRAKSTLHFSFLRYYQNTIKLLQME